MPEDQAKTRQLFTATHHALLFAWISRAVLQRTGEAQGEAVIRAAVRHYGAQRGRRMALRAEASGHPLTMTSYMTYGEWRAGDDEMAREITRIEPHLRAVMNDCPWHEAWAEHNLMAYGRLYCLEIDEALVRGFSPNLRLDVNCTRTNGGPYCEFVYHDVNPAAAADIEPPEDAVMPWAYHLGHLYKAMHEVVVRELGPMGEEAIGAALADFAARYGEAAAQIITAYRDTDFNRLPEGLAPIQDGHAQADEP
jgi:hypothetical protein